MDSSRMPPQIPSNCPLCGAEVAVESLDSGHLDTCPTCGVRFHLAADALELFQRRFGENLSPRHPRINQDMTLADLGANSLDTVEFVLEMEELFNFRVHEDALDQFDSVGDIIRFIQRQQRNSSD